MWIFFSLISRFLWAVTNAVDQVFSRAHTTEKTKSVFVLSCICELPFGLLSLTLAGGVASFDAPAVKFLCVAVAAHLAALIPYFYALQKEEAYNITPLMETVPVFLIIMAVVFNNETLTSMQGIGAAMIIGSGFVFSWDFNNSKIKTSVLWPVMCCCLLFAFAQFSIRSATTHANVWQITGFMMTADGIIGILAFAALPKIRKSILSTLKHSRGKSGLIGFISNLFSFLGLASIAQAFATAPSTGHVASLSGTQPFFSFLIAVILAKLLPHHFEKIKFDHQTKIKLGLLVVIFAGICLLTNG